ncbi:MAG TPA: hydantoinase B/oxoprolinase family protein [Terriglobales bacterium]|nr:hydantoinase B/oxoprolinase family protein [Terriglobales bacterium]
MPRRDPVELEIFKNLFHSIAEEMGAALRRTAFSPNIKERRDYSCAVFDAQGDVIAMGDHMPVHLGSMPMSVRAAIEQLQLGLGDVAMLNDPFRGGTHLPDITLVAPVFIGRRGEGNGRSQPLKRLPERKNNRAKPDFYVASRAHHADVGGTYPGSMGICREVYQEGFRVPPVKLIRGGTIDRDVLSLLLANVRTPGEREGDLSAQIASCHTGRVRLEEICSRYGLARVRRAAQDLLAYSEEIMRAFLALVPAGTYRAEDFLDDDGVSDQPVRIRASIAFRAAAPVGRYSASGKAGEKIVIIDFQGSDAQVAGSLNAVEAVTWSACFYVFRCLLSEDVPATAGLMRPIRVIAPAGTIVNPGPPAAVAGGNVETSQRIVDVLLRALAQALPQRIPAAASGTMNNLTVGGIDPRSGEPFAYYETVAGGMGARPSKAGVSGVHTHMTNSLNTPIEALEYAYPFRVTRYALRPGSGGIGKYRGGEGIIREIEVQVESEVTILSDRRKFAPYGLVGGGDGTLGESVIVRRNGAKEPLAGKSHVRLLPGERIRIETPGGGGWGSA